MVWFTRIKKFFEQNLWTKEQVKEAVDLNKITKEEYKKITGEEYETN